MSQERGSWLRDRDILGAWGFRILASGLLGLLLWNGNNYAKTVDELQKEVPVLSNTIAALNNRLSSEQDQISKIWDRLLDNALKKK